MAISVTTLDRVPKPDQERFTISTRFKIEFDSSYPLGGYSIDFRDYVRYRIKEVWSNQYAGYRAEWDNNTNKLLVTDGGYEVDNGADLSDIFLVIHVEGYWGGDVPTLAPTSIIQAKGTGDIADLVARIVALETEIAQFNDLLKLLTSEEITQLLNINDSEFSADQWAYLASLSPTEPPVTTVIVFDDGDTTPDVNGGTLGITQNTGATTITCLDNGVNGQILYILFGDNNTTLENGTCLQLLLGLNATFQSGDVIGLSYYNTKWYEIERCVKP